jgi:hypothetical protein
MERQKEAARKAAIDAALSSHLRRASARRIGPTGTSTAGMGALETGGAPAQILPGSLAPSASAWLSSGLPAMARRSDARTGLAAAPGPEMARHVWLESRRVNGAAGFTVGSQPVLGPPRARPGSQRRSEGGGQSGEAELRVGPYEVVVVEVRVPSNRSKSEHRGTGPYGYLALGDGDRSRGTDHMATRASRLPGEYPSASSGPQARLWNQRTESGFRGCSAQFGSLNLANGSTYTPTPWASFWPSRVLP